MNYSDLIILTMELVGTIAFAYSGAMLAIQKEMDLFGVCVLGITTAVGGGLIRDLVLGLQPPNMFRNPIYTLVALIVSILLFALLYFKHDLLHSKIARTYDQIMLLFDTIGLGIFTVVGVNTGWTMWHHRKFLLVFVGLMTGVGGGLLRDMMAQEKPYILTKHIYACASLAGAVICVYSKNSLGTIPSMLTGAFTVILIRFWAARYHWNLPRIPEIKE